MGASYLYVTTDLGARLTTSDGKYILAVDAYAMLPTPYAQGPAVRVSGGQSPGEVEEVQYDTSGSTKIYSTSIPYGNYGSQVATCLAQTDEAEIAALQSLGWQAIPYYNYENQIGAYAGYTFESPVNVSKCKFWLNRYSAQNKNLPVNIQWMDSSNEWHTIATVTITTSLQYPSYVFEIDYSGVEDDIYGVRWYHDTVYNTGGNNITFAGMTVYHTIGSEYTNPNLYRSVMDPDDVNGHVYRLSVHGLNSYRLIETQYDDNDDLEIP